MRIEIWSDVVCPWCFVGKRRLESALAGFEHREQVEVVYRSFQLDPSAPQHGHERTTPVLARKYGRSEEEMRGMQDQLTALAAQEGLDFRLQDTLHTRTIDAHRLLHHALATGGVAAQDRLKEALLSAYFERAADVGDHAVLREVAVAAGFDGDEVAEVLSGDRYAEEVAADIDRAFDLGVSGVPFFLVDERLAVSGAQPTELFAQLLERAWSERRPAVQVVAGASEGECGPDGCAI